MKKILKIFLSVVVFFSLNNFFFSEEFKNIETKTEKNSLKIWSVDDEIYKNLCALYIREGFAIPSDAGPWSSDELEKMLDNFSGSFNDDISFQLYEKIYSELHKETRFKTKDNLFFNVYGIFTPELYLHTNPDNFNKESDWNYDYEKRKELLSFENELWISNALYIYTDFGISYGASVFNQYDYDEDDILYSPFFNINIPYLSGTNFSVLNLNFPRRAFISTGGNNWSLSFGRDVIRWGSGESGNLLLGGNSLYDTNIRFSVYYDKFKYSCITNFYPHNSMLENSDQNATVSGIRFFMAHRLDFRFFRDKMSFSIAEGMMYQNKDSFADLTILNPQVILHNLFIRGNANSIMCIDFDYTIIKGLTVYSQLLVDEYSFWGEPDSSSSSGWRPTKLDGLFGVKYFPPIKKGVLKLSLEGVYADPYLYLREKYNSDEGKYGVSFYGNLKEYSSNKGLYYVRNCIGYKYGGDCITANLRADYDSLGKWNAVIEFFYMAHGIIYQDLDDDWIYGKKTYAPSTTDLTGSSNADGYVEHTFRLSLEYSYDFFDWMNVYSGIDNFLIINKNNVKKSPVYDLQFYAGVSLRF